MDLPLGYFGRPEFSKTLLKNMQMIFESKLQLLIDNYKSKAFGFQESNLR